MTARSGGQNVSNSTFVGRVCDLRPLLWVTARALSEAAKTARTGPNSHPVSTAHEGRGAAPASVQNVTEKYRVAAPKSLAGPGPICYNYGLRAGAGVAQTPHPGAEHKYSKGLEDAA